MEKYTYNGKYLTFSEYSIVIRDKTGLNIKLIKKRIRKGWSFEKIIIPSTVKRPICQYDLNGVFVKKHESVIEAIKIISDSSKTGIRMSLTCMKSKNGDDKKSGGFIWRYADQISDFTKNIDVKITEPYNSTPDRKYLRDKYDTINEFCYKKEGRYYNNIKIKLWDEWANDFEKFYKDLLPHLKAARIEYKSYKRREKRPLRLKNAPDHLYKDHVWFCRIDKTDGYYPWNIKFMTPDWASRYKPNSHRVIVDGEIKFVPQIYDELKDLDKKNIKEFTIRKNVVENKNILSFKDKRPYNYKGTFYTRNEAVDKFNLNPIMLTNYLVRHGDEAVERAINYKGRNLVLFEGKQYRIFELSNKIKSEGCELTLQAINSRIDSYIKNDNRELSRKDFEKILKSVKLENVTVKYKGEIVRLSDLCKEKNFEYTIAWKRYKRGCSIDELFKPPVESKTLNYLGVEYTINEIAKKTGLTNGAIVYRVKNNWSVEDIFKKN